MYRKSVDYGQQSTIQISQFSVFRRKSGEQTPEITIQNQQQMQIRLRKSNNSILLAIMIGDLLLQSSSKSKTKKGQPTSTNTNKIFKDFTIENVPKIHYNYQHQSTLEQLLTSIYSKVKDENLKQVHDLITNYTVTQFVLNCYARKLIKNYISFNSNQIDLLGNEDQILVDYTIQLRGQLIQALARSCRINLCICYRDAAGHLEENYRQYYGEKNSGNKIELFDMGEYLKICIKTQQQEVKLSTASSSQNILQNESKNNKESLNSTIEPSVRPQSRSANKDIRCNKCNSKGSCQCEKIPKRVIVRQISNNLTGPSGGPRSIFDSIGLGTAPKRQTSTHEINSAKR